MRFTGVQFTCLTDIFCQAAVDDVADSTIVNFLDIILECDEIRIQLENEVFSRTFDVDRLLGLAALMLLKSLEFLVEDSNILKAIKTEQSSNRSSRNTIILIVAKHVEILANL